jgi:hypothetical protein
MRNVCHQLEELMSAGKVISKKGPGRDSRLEQDAATGPQRVVGHYSGEALEGNRDKNDSLRGRWRIFASLHKARVASVPMGLLLAS